MNPHDLKQLQVRKAKLQAECSRFEMEAKSAQKAWSETLNQISAIDKQIKGASRELTVSEHALLRFVERTYGVDLSKLQDQILTDSLKELAKKLGNGKYPIAGHGVKAVVRDMVVVSIVGGDQ